VKEESEGDLLGEVDDDIVSSSRSSSHAHSGAGKTWVIVAVFVGIIVGVYMAGKPAEAPTAPTSTAPTSTGVGTEEDTEARKAELIALLTEDPSNADAHLELGVIYFNEDNLDSAKAEWTLVTGLDPTAARAWYNLGFYYLYQDPPDYASAREVWEKVVSLDPSSDLAQTVLNHMDAFDDPSASETPTDEETGQ